MLMNQFNSSTVSFPFFNIFKPQAVSKNLKIA